MGIADAIAQMDPASTVLLINSLFGPHRASAGFDFPKGCPRGFTIPSPNLVPLVIVERQRMDSPRSARAQVAKEPIEAMARFWDREVGGFSDRPSG